jgi:hypothetical protein
LGWQSGSQGWLLLLTELFYSPSWHIDAMERDRCGGDAKDVENRGRTCLPMN